MKTSIGILATILAYKADGKETKEVAFLTGVPIRTINDIFSMATSVQLIT